MATMALNTRSPATEPHAPLLSSSTTPRRDLLDRTLDQEANADKLLTNLATGGFLASGINDEER